MSEATVDDGWFICGRCDHQFSHEQFHVNSGMGLATYACPKCGSCSRYTRVQLPAHGAPGSFIRRVQEQPQIAAELLAVCKLWILVYSGDSLDAAYAVKKLGWKEGDGFYDDFVARRAAAAIALAEADESKPAPGSRPDAFDLQDLQ